MLLSHYFVHSQFNYLILKNTFCCCTSIIIFVGFAIPIIEFVLRLCFHSCHHINVKDCTAVFLHSEGGLRWGLQIHFMLIWGFFFQPWIASPHKYSPVVLCCIWCWGNPHIKFLNLSLLKVILLLKSEYKQLRMSFDPELQPLSSVWTAHLSLGNTADRYYTGAKFLINHH